PGSRAEPRLLPRWRQVPRSDGAGDGHAVAVRSGRSDRMRTLNLDWKLNAACWNTDQTPFFPPGDDPDIPDQANRLCNNCPVNSECLDYAVSIRPTAGIWAGLTADGVKRERRRRYMRQRKGVA